MGRYLITQRSASDQDPPPGQTAVLSSSVYTSCFTASEVVDENGNVIEQSELGWSASSSASYNGNNAQFRGNYNVRVKIHTYSRQNAGNFLGTLIASESLTMSLKPIPMNTTADIGDCEGTGRAYGIDPTDNSSYSTESTNPY